MKKLYIFFTLFLAITPFSFAYTIDTYDFVPDYNVMTVTNMITLTDTDQELLAIVGHAPNCDPTGIDVTFDSVNMDLLENGGSANGGTLTYLSVYKINSLYTKTLGTFSLTVDHVDYACGVVLSWLLVSGVDVSSANVASFYNDSGGSAVSLFTSSGYATTSSMALWLYTAQSGNAVLSDIDFLLQPELVFIGMGMGWATSPVISNFSYTLQSAPQNFRGFLVVFPDSGGGGGGGNYIYTSGALTTDDIFNIGSTTLSFGAIDYTACDVSSISVDLFASTTLNWGTFSVPTCILQSFKLLLFGTNGFDSYNITNFVNNSSSTLPFLMFKFMGGALVYINPLTGQLINLPNATSSLVYSVPLFGTSSPFLIDIRASSTFLTSLQVPEPMDKAIATIEMVVFFLIWAIIFRYINI